MGMTGPRGLQGEQGPRGERGPRGFTGPQGARGPAGAANIFVSGEFVAFADRDGAGTANFINLGPVSGRACFLTTVQMAEIDGDIERGNCSIARTMQGNWRLEASVRNVGDNRVICGATCISF